MTDANGEEGAPTALDVLTDLCNWAMDTQGPGVVLEELCRRREALIQSRNHVHEMGVLS